MTFYHDGMRELQDRYEGRAVADLIEELRMHTQFTDQEKDFIESVPFFFLATASTDSVDCSFKGGSPGFVQVISNNQLAWPDYDGNRTYRSLGNIKSNQRVGLLFLSLDGTLFDGMSARLRINGRARIDDSLDAIDAMPGAKRIVRVTVDHIFPNCPRYIPEMSMGEPSIYAPREGHTVPEPEWKSRPHVKDIFDAEKGN
jgi:predicted pyridoxine 5'-phosphate oxidase superfamily flavin-nucleotide-binding protein